jgi:hypothetical protein
MACDKFQVLHVPRGLRTFEHALPPSFRIEDALAGVSLPEPFLVRCVSRYPQLYCSCGPEGPMYRLEWNVEDEYEAPEHVYCERCGDCTRCEAQIGYSHYCDDCMRCAWDCSCEGLGRP